MATNTLGEFSDGEDDWVFEINENVWNTNTLGEFSDGEDDFVFEIDENAGMDLLGGCGGVHTPPSPGQVGCRGGAIFMIKQKNMRDIMKYTL